MPWGGATGGRIRATSAFAVHPPFPAPRRSPAHPPPRPLRGSLPALSRGSRPSQSEALAPGPGSARGRSWLPQPPPAEAPGKFARGSSPLPPRPHQASRSPGRSRGCRLRGRSRRRCSTGRARAAEEGSVRAEGGSPRAARCAALRVYRDPAARSPRPPPCALLTSFILSHPCPPTPFPNSDSLGGARSPRPWLPGRRAELEKPVRLLKKGTSADSLFS